MLLDATLRGLGTPGVRGVSMARGVRPTWLPPHLLQPDRDLSPPGITILPTQHSPPAELHSTPTGSLPAAADGRTGACPSLDRRDPKRHPIQGGSS